MIKKIILVLFMLLVLTGCSSDNFSASITTAIDKAITEYVPDVENNNSKKEYYNYYLDKNVGKLSGDEITNQFNIQGNDASLALDISSIALNTIEVDTNKYELRDIGTIENVIYTKTGRYFNSEKQMIPYRVNIAEIDSEYLVMIQTSQFIFISRVSNGTVANTVHDMLVLLRTCSVNERQVVIDYASEGIISTTPNIITLFRQIIPETGYIIDYIDDWKDNTEFIRIQRNTDVEEENDVEENQQEESQESTSNAASLIEE